MSDFADWFNEAMEAGWTDAEQFIQELKTDGAGEVLKDATIRDKRGKYRNGDFLVVPLGEDAE